MFYDCCNITGVVFMNRDIDIRECVVDIKFDRGHEESVGCPIDLGQTCEGHLLRVVTHKDKEGNVVRIRVQML